MQSENPSDSLETKTDSLVDTGKGSLCNLTIGLSVRSALKGNTEDKGVGPCPTDISELEQASVGKVLVSETVVVCLEDSIYSVVSSSWSDNMFSSKEDGLESRVSIHVNDPTEAGVDGSAAPCFAVREIGSANASADTCLGEIVIFWCGEVSNDSSVKLVEDCKGRIGSSLL